MVSLGKMTSTSSKAFHRLKGGGDAGAVKIIVDRDMKFQEIFGFGGAFTDATGINIESLPESLQDTIIR